MPRRDEYVPKHRGPTPQRVLKRGVRKTLLLSGVAVATTGLAVTSGVLAQPDGVGDEAVAARRAAPQVDPDRAAEARLSDRERATSRSSDRRTAALPQRRATRDRSPRDPRDIARSMLSEHGFSGDQFGCLDALYVSESGWDPRADNPTSSAYGIPQALTETHDDLPADYMTNPASQIEWGLDYIRSSYGTPCAAWEFKQANNWY